MRVTSISVFLTQWSWYVYLDFFKCNIREQKNQSNTQSQYNYSKEGQRGMESMEAFYFTANVPSLQIQKTSRINTNILCRSKLTGMSFPSKSGRAGQFNRDIHVYTTCAYWSKIVHQMPYNLIRYRFILNLCNQIYRNTTMSYMYLLHYY